MKSRLAAMTAAVALVVGALIGLAPAAYAAPASERVSGSDRFATAVATSKLSYSSAPVVVISNANNYPNSVTASALAARLNGPLLFTPKATLPTIVKNEIKRLGAKRIIIAGGTRDVSAEVETQLRALAGNVQRATGTTRYEVSAALVRMGWPPASVNSRQSIVPAPAPGVTPSPVPSPSASASPSPVPAPSPSATPRPSATHTPSPTPAPTATATPQATAPEGAVTTVSMVTTASTTTATRPAAPYVIMATGESFADGLTGGAFAAANDAPLLLVKGTATSLDASTRTLLTQLGTTRVTLLGGTTAITSGLAQSLRTLGISVDRIAGRDRYGTANAVAAAFPNKGSTAVIASGTAFADGLAAVNLSHARRAPVLLSPPLCVGQGVRDWVARNGTKKVTLIGGSMALRGTVATLMACRSTTDPKSTWLMVNKKNPLNPRSYVPSDLRYISGTGYMLRSSVATAFEQMRSAASNAGAGRLGTNSAYRSYNTQRNLYANYVATMGQAWADRQSARAGHSEHQTGMTLDVIACGSGCGSIYAFEGTKQQKWVAANAWRYGFIVRYESGYTDITGYASEPWHLRYVGKELAKAYRDGGFRTLETFLGYPAAPRY